MHLLGLVVFLVGTTFAFSFRSLGGRPLSSSAAKLSSTLKMASFYDIVETGSKGEAVPLSQFRGKVVYGVNVASKCGYTAAGYALLEKISAMKAQGVEVMILPCNQFGGQEPGSAAEIDSFCALKGVVGANVFAKADVNGAPPLPLHLSYFFVLPPSLSSFPSHRTVRITTLRLLTDCHLTHSLPPSLVTNPTTRPRHSRPGHAPCVQVPQGAGRHWRVRGMELRGCVD